MILDPVYKHLEVTCFAGDCHSGIAGQASDKQLGCHITQHYLQSVIGKCNCNVDNAYHRSACVCFHCAIAVLYRHPLAVLHITCHFWTPHICVSVPVTNIATHI